MMLPRPCSWVNIDADSREQSYMASKAALTNFSFYLADELKESNIAAGARSPPGGCAGQALQRG
jgi:NAD(P)-dependent dehydrogenase (short-subunit alcohol dehydrogenase family)